MTAFPAYLRPEAPSAFDERDWIGHIVFGKLDIKATLEAGKPVHAIEWTPIPADIAAPRPLREAQHPALLPCPFCGGDSLLQESRGWEHEERFHIECQSCAIMFGFVEDDHEVDALEHIGSFLNAVEASLAWNRRPKIRATRGKNA